MAITINGSGTLTGITAGGLPDATITQADLAANVAGNGPAFSAYASNSQTINQAVDTKIQLNTEEFDTNSNFDKDTNYRFTPTVAGYYQISWCVAVGNASSESLLFKNGSRYKIASTGTSDGAYAFSSGSTIVYLNGSTDYIELYTYITGGSAKSTLQGSIFTYMNGAMIRAA